MTSQRLRQLPLAVALVLAFAGVLVPAEATIAAQDATPSPAYVCGAATPAASTPMTGMDNGAMTMGTPEVTAPFDQLYIDMMIPHHQSVIALAQATLPELTDPRLVEIAQNVISTQAAEQEELRQLRAEWYGSPEPAPMDQAYMQQMMAAMPSLDVGMASMQELMSPEWLVSTFCAAEEPNLEFIDLTIPHHQMAIAASEDAIERAEHEEIVQIATDVVAGQREETVKLEEIRADLHAVHGRAA